MSSPDVIPAAEAPWTSGPGRAASGTKTMSFIGFLMQLVLLGMEALG